MLRVLILNIALLYVVSASRADYSGYVFYNYRKLMYKLDSTTLILVKHFWLLKANFII